MEEAKYLIVGSSHAGLEALNAIRMLDQDGTVAMVTRDQSLPYSPTILPYVVSGRSDPQNIALRDDSYFERFGVAFRRGAALSALDVGTGTALLETGEEWRYEKLLLATGARPAIPPVAGLEETPFHVLRTLDDALGLRTAIGRARSALVLGAGLIGMHAAENLVEAGCEVTVVEKEPRVLPGYFDDTAARLIERAFAERGVRMVTGRVAVGAARHGQRCTLTLEDGAELSADLLLVSTGVAPEIGYLEGSGVEADRGVLVDDAMGTSVTNIWAAGDVAQARDFYGPERIVNGILPDAVEQGRIAGMSMVDDPALKAYPGGVPLNTFTFFGQHAISVGLGGAVEPGDGLEIDEVLDAGRGHCRKIVMEEGKLLGISGVNMELDAGIMWQLILRRVDLGAVKNEFIARPQDTGRFLMSSIWR
jgi:phenylglyoxylate dehydrogenase epsilon subunit